MAGGSGDLHRSKANDLREQLIYWGTPPEATWPAREQRLDWLEFALMEARDIAMGLRQHGALTEGSHGLETYVDIVKVPHPPPEEVAGLLHTSGHFITGCGLRKGLICVAMSRMQWQSCAL